MPEEGLYELSIISKSDNKMYCFTGNTWGKVIHQAFVQMNKNLKKDVGNKINS